MNTDNYDAFISYRHISPDMQIAEKIQNILEQYKAPRKAECKRKRKIDRCFRDVTELPISADLGHDIIAALDKSEFFIAVCSPEYLKSKYCMDEVEYFKKIRGGSNKNMLVVLVDGTPEESIPEVLRFDKKITVSENGIQSEEEVEVEPIFVKLSDCAGLNEKKKRLKNEYLRLAAPILGCRYDELYRRHKRRMVKRLVMGLCAFSVAAGFSGYREVQKSVIEEKAEFEQNIIQLEKAESFINDGDKLLANLLVKDVLEDLKDEDEYIMSYADSLLSESTYFPAWSGYGILRTDEAVTDIEFFEDESFAALPNGKTLSFFNVLNGEEMAKTELDFEIGDICASEDVLYAIGNGGEITVVDMENYRVQNEYTVSMPYDECYIIDSQIYNNKLVFLYGVIETGEGRKCVSVYDFDTNKAELITDAYWDKTIPYSDDTKMAFYEDGEVLIPEKDKLYLLNLKTNEKTVITEVSNEYIKSLPVKGKTGNNLIISILNGKELSVYDTENGNSVSVNYGDDFGGGDISSVELSQDGRFLAVAYYKEGNCKIVDLWDSSLKVYDVNKNSDYAYCTGVSFINNNEILLRLGSGGNNFDVYRFSEEYGGFCFVKRTEIGGVNAVCSNYGMERIAISDETGKTRLFTTTDDSSEKDISYADYGDLYYEYDYYNAKLDRGIYVEDETVYCVKLSDKSVIYSYTFEKEPIIYAVSENLEFILAGRKDEYILTDLKNQTSEVLQRDVLGEYDAMQIIDSEKIIALSGDKIYDVKISDGTKTLISTLDIEAPSDVLWNIKTDTENDRVIVSHSYAGNLMDSNTYVFKLSTGRKMFEDEGFYFSGYTLNTSCTEPDSVYYAYNVFEKKLDVLSFEEISEKAEEIIDGRILTDYERNL